MPLLLAPPSTTANEWGAGATSDGLEVVFARATSGFQQEIFTAKRSNFDAGFSIGTVIPELSAISDESDPSLSGDGLVLAFMSNRNGSYDVFLARRMSRAAPFGTPQSITEVNTNGPEHTPTISADAEVLCFSSNRSGGSMDIWCARRGASGLYGAPVMQSAVSTPGDDTGIALSPDGLTLYSSSGGNTPGNGRDVRRSTRPNLDAQFGAPVDVVELNGTGFDYPSGASSDDCVLFFSSDRAGSMDLYVGVRGR